MVLTSIILDNISLTASAAVSQEQYSSTTAVLDNILISPILRSKTVPPALVEYTSFLALAPIRPTSKLSESTSVNTDRDCKCSKWVSNIVIILINCTTIS